MAEEKRPYYSAALVINGRSFAIQEVHIHFPEIMASEYGIVAAGPRPVKFDGVLLPVKQEDLP